MKTILISLFILCLPLAAGAQESHEKQARNRAVYLEIGGGSPMVGINYDARFNDHTRWGWRTGLGFGYAESSGVLMDGSTSLRAWGVPLAVNYLVGNRKNSLELELGANLGLYNGHYHDYTFEDVDEATFQRELDHPSPGVAGMIDRGGSYALVYEHNESKNKFGYFLFGNIGYRHVANSGFLFRAGLTPTLNFGGKHGVYRGFGDDYHKLGLFIYLGAGWAF